MLASALALAKPFMGPEYGDASKPMFEGGWIFQLGNPLECANEDVVKQVRPFWLSVADQVGEHALDVRTVALE